MGDIWNTVLFYPFLNIFLVLYHFLGSNLGFAVIAIAVIVRILLIPSTKSQTEMTSKLMNIRPELEKLQKKYANNQEKLVKEQMKLYKNSGYNPVGCLGSLIPQLVILYVIFQVIRVVTGNHFDGMYSWVSSLVFNGGTLVLNSWFFGIDLAKAFNSFIGSDRFTLKALPYIVLAVSVALIQFVTTKFAQLIQNPTPPKKIEKKGDEMPTPEELQQQMMSSMNYMFPIMTGVITLSTPAVLGLYWLAQSAMLLVQYFVLEKEKSMNIVKSYIPKNIKDKLNIK